MREPFPKPGPQFVLVDVVVGRVVTDEDLLTRGGIQNGGGCREDPRCTVDGPLDLLQFDAVAVQLDLRVHPAVAVDLPRREHAAQVAGSVIAPRARPEGVGDELLLRQFGSVEVTLRHTAATDPDLAEQSRGKTSTTLDDSDVYPIEGMADGEPPKLLTRVARVGGVDGCLGGTVHVVDGGPGEGEHVLRQREVQGFAADEDPFETRNLTAVRHDRAHGTQIRGRAVEGINPLGGEQPDEGGDVVAFILGDDADVAPSQESPEARLHGHVECKGGDKSEPLRPRVLPNGGEAVLDEVHQRPALDKHPLWLARGAGGVDAVGEARRVIRDAMDGLGDRAPGGGGRGHRLNVNPIGPL